MGNTCRAQARNLPLPRRRWTMAIVVAALSWALAGIAPNPAAGQELGLQDSDAGYIDNAIVANRIRFRFDSAYNNPFADRAEFFYPTCGCFPGAPGPPLPESSVDYNELEVDFEVLSTLGFPPSSKSPSASSTPWRMTIPPG